MIFMQMYKYFIFFQEFKVPQTTSCSNETDDVSQHRLDFIKKKKRQIQIVYENKQIQLKTLEKNVCELEWLSIQGKSLTDSNKRKINKTIQMLNNYYTWAKDGQNAGIFFINLI